jgi:hypothetical protein
MMEAWMPLGRWRAARGLFASFMGLAMRVISLVRQTTAVSSCEEAFEGPRRGAPDVNRAVADGKRELAEDLGGPMQCRIAGFELEIVSRKVLHPSNEVHFQSRACRSRFAGIESREIA